MIEKKLLAIKEKIDTAKELQAKNQGKLAHIEEELKSLLSVISLDNIEEIITEEEEKLEEMKQEIAQQIEKFEKLPEFN